MGMDRPGVSKADITKWWREVTDDDLCRYLAKRTEYGSFDLSILGDVLQRTMDDEALKIDANEEIGITFYMLGKLARVLSAYKEGRVPSDDTWDDLAIYAMMGRMARKGLL